MENMLYYNGTIYPSFGAAATADSMLVHGDRVASIGAHHEVASGAHGARRIDLDGAVVVPGFNDSHAHVLSFGLTLEQVDVSADAVRSVDDILRAVHKRAVDTEGSEWVHGHGYNHNELHELRHVTRHELDAVSGTHAVVLDHTSGHVLVCNTEALRQAGISRQTDNPPGGRIVRDEHGEPTGLLEESAMDVLRRVIPATTPARARDAVLKALNFLASYGITSISDAWTGGVLSLETEFDVYASAARSSEQKVRVTLMPLLTKLAPLLDEPVPPPTALHLDADAAWLRIGPTKIFADGALSTRTAAMREPYSDDPGDRGVLFWESDILRERMQAAHDAGWHIATHALGDRAVEQVLDCLEHVLTRSPRTDHRHRIEHCMYADAGLARRMSQLGVVPNMQPDIYRLGDAYVRALGEQRAAASIPTGLFRRHNVRFVFSSDLPVIPGRPLDVIRSAIDRTTPRGIRLGPTEAISARDAFHAYTWGGAFATHTDSFMGSLGAGMLADFTLLSSDPLRRPTDEWPDIQVVRTVVGGVETYRAS